MELAVNGIFKINRQRCLGGEDYRVLTRMYLPLIGVDSFALYHLLNVIDEAETPAFKFLLDSLNFPSLSYLDRAFAKLEAVALVGAYHNKQKDAYLFVVRPPLSAVAFASNPLLYTFLQGQIGPLAADKLRESPTAVTRSYQEVTRPFDSVFTVTGKSLKNVFDKMLNVKSLDGAVKIEYDEFDYIFFKLSFDSEFIDPKLFDDEEFKQNILSLAYMYKLNEQEMIEVVKKTITVDKDLKYSDLSKNSRALYQKKYKTDEPRFVTKEPDIWLDSVTDDDTYRFLEKIETISPADLLAELSGIKPSVSELKMIENLVKNTNFPLGVINIMILWVCHEKGGEIPGYNYFEKIANTWARAKIKTPLDALKHINKEQKARETTPAKGKKTMPVPDWYDKYEKQLADLPKRQDLSPEEIKQIMDSMKETK
jgi:replication initiation and membrane attachment protein